MRRAALRVRAPTPASAGAFTKTPFLRTRKGSQSSSAARHDRTRQAKKTSHEGLALHAQKLFQLGYDLHQVGLLGHHLLDVLVRLGRFVDDAAVFAALHALGLALQVRHVEAALGLAAAHPPPGAVRRRFE